MAFRRQRFTEVLLLFLLLEAAAAVPTSRSLKAAKDPGSVGNFHTQDVMGTGKDDWVSKLQGRMNLELEDYPGTGANNNHDPKTPGRI
ncbi:hypothetical protein CDL12_10438 [Handroanthus impetiginosus]|uniref:Uncharacterized protein n=1 Tax=Handroanthus impetiginosus TaxID=429701 RepID=A0A2G9HHC8_9LAMI|nr:hypothetical protein CDL12_10438 [Handroanthus impetiginosus]